MSKYKQACMDAAVLLAGAWNREMGTAALDHFRVAIERAPNASSRGRRERLFADARLAVAAMPDECPRCGRTDDHAHTNKKGKAKQ